MISFIITNTLDIGIWSISKFFNGVYYAIYGDVERQEKECMKRELLEIKRELSILNAKLSVV